MNAHADMDAVAGETPGCREFLALHSEYVDERLDPAVAERLTAHRAGCVSCARYDEVVRRGGALVASLGEVRISEAFHDRLRHRLLHEEDEARASRSGSGASLASSVGIAAVLAAVAWSPLLGPAVRPAADHFRGIDPHRPVQPLIPVTRLGSVGALPAPLFVPVGADYLAAPGPYSPLVIKSPAMRLVSTGEPSTQPESRPVD